MWWQLRRADRDEYRAKIREQLDGLDGFVPESVRERAWFRGMAWTAGFCEEVVYRGFLLWYLEEYVPLPAAIAIMAVGFGATHLYQGVHAAAQIAAIGVVAALFYVGSGSLWIPIGPHVALDLFQLELTTVALRPRD